MNKALHDIAKTDKAMRDPSEVIAAVKELAESVSGQCYRGKEWESDAGEKLLRMIATLPASTPPGDACVRHACKRVRMEMRAEIERLRGLLRRCYTERMTDELDEAIGAAIKGDRHAGCDRAPFAIVEGEEFAGPQDLCLAHRNLKQKYAELLAIAEGAEADRALLREARGWIGHTAGTATEPSSLIARIDAALAGAVTQGEG